MNKRPLNCKHLLYIAILFSSFAIAEDRVSLPDVVITSKPVDTFSQTLNDTHLNQDDLQRSGQREITNVLRATPGLALSQGMKGGASTISLRGASGSMGLVNIDGIPLHDTWPGALNLDLFPAETFGSTDIQRGSAAILNFGRTLGGTINLHSRNNRENSAKLHLEGGSWGSLRETVTADLSNDHHSLNLTAGRDDLFDGAHWADSRQGNSERDDVHAYQLAMHLRDQFSEHTTLDSSVYYINNHSGADKIGLTGINPPELNIVDDPGRLKQEIWLSQSTASIDLHPQWHSELQLGYTEHRASAVIGDVLPGSAPYLIGFVNQLSLARWKNSHQQSFDPGSNGLWQHSSIRSLRRPANRHILSDFHGKKCTFKRIDMHHGHDHRACQSRLW